MLGEIFKALLITSLAGSCLTAIITIVKPITKRVFGYSWHYYIWLAVLAVMVLPVRFTLPQRTDIPPVTATQTVQTEQTVQAVQNTDNIVSDVQTEPQTDIWQAGTSLVKRVIDNRLNILAYLWLTGLVLLMLINLIGYIRLIIEMRKNSVVVSCPELMNFTNKRVTVRVWENTSSPFMTGIFKPTLVLPAENLSEEQLNNILSHEMTHFKRHDILYKWLVSIVKCLHWFNPVIWYVATQINAECEISCDMAVTLAMSKAEEMSYIDTVLSLLPTGETKQIPLTTQMASSKRVLKRRFEMIRNKRRTSKFVSVLSVVIAVIMLGTTVFASGVLSDLATDDYTIEITNNGEKIELTNKPFIENSEVYVPLRNLFEKVGIMDNPNSEIIWNDGKIEFAVAFYDNSAEVIDAHKSLNNGQGVDSVTFIFNYGIEIGKPELKEKSKPDYWTASSMNNAPVLRNGTTYIPYSYIRDICNNTQQWNINYSAYDKNGNEIFNIRDLNGTVIISSQYDNKSPEYTIEQFFNNLEISQYEQANKYCYDLVKVDKYSFAPQKIISDIKVDYTKDSFGQISAEVYTKYIDKKIPEVDNQFVHWKIHLKQEDDNRYLINGWESITDIAFDESGNLIDRRGNSLSVGTIMVDENNTVVYKGENLINPESTINGFFEAFADGDFALMKNYCTENGRNTFFGDGYCFGMTKAELTDVTIVDDSRFDFVAFVGVNMTPHERSVFDPSQTSTGFYLILKKQNDGRYLIDEFATGL